jgi:hypothetical protein
VLERIEKSKLGSPSCFFNTESVRCDEVTRMFPTVTATDHRRALAVAHQAKQMVDGALNAAAKKAVKEGE